MTEFRVEVVRLGKIGKCPNSDTLSITTVHGYPVIFKTGEFQQGDLAVRIPPDALVPVERQEFAWLADKAVNGLFRVKSTRIRGIPSHGFLVPVPRTPNGDEAYSAGQDVRGLLGVTKYEPGPGYQLIGGGEHETCPVGDMVPLYDIEGLRRYEDLFEPGEEVVITEKIHGANGRWLSIAGKLFCGSRTRFRRDSVWNEMAKLYDLERILGLAENQGLVLYGEVYGSGIQDLTYGLKKSQRVAFFDIYDTRKGVWWRWDDFESWCSKYGLPVVPILRRGPFNLKECYGLAEGTSVLAEEQVREGIVVKPVIERWDQEVGRVFLKLPGEGYLLREKTAGPVDSKPSSKPSVWMQALQVYYRLGRRVKEYFRGGESNAA